MGAPHPGLAVIVLCHGDTAVWICGFLTHLLLCLFIDEVNVGGRPTQSPSPCPGCEVDWSTH